MTCSLSYCPSCSSALLLCTTGLLVNAQRTAINHLSRKATAWCDGDSRNGGVRGNRMELLLIHLHRLVSLELQPSATGLQQW